MNKLSLLRYLYQRSTNFFCNVTFIKDQQTFSVTSPLPKINKLSLLRHLYQRSINFLCYVTFIKDQQTFSVTSPLSKINKLSLLRHLYQISTNFLCYSTLNKDKQTFSVTSRQATSPLKKERRKTKQDLKACPSIFNWDTNCTGLLTGRSG